MGIILFHALSSILLSGKCSLSDKAVEGSFKLLWEEDEEIGGE